MIVVIFLWFFVDTGGMFGSQVPIEPSNSGSCSEPVQVHLGSQQEMDAQCGIGNSIRNWSDITEAFSMQAMYMNFSSSVVYLHIKCFQ